MAARMYENLVFVYGSLRKGGDGSMSARYPAAKFVGNGVVNGRLYDLGDYPGLELSESDSRVAGEVYEVSESLLKMLDEFEVTSRYVRRQVEISLNGDLKKCWIYVPEFSLGGLPVEKLVTSGDWTEYQGKKYLNL
jgi:gamma-glutamylcyclotransferase (GGCT)/AIG2-like uncharacterized protein YtfP